LWLFKGKEWEQKCSFSCINSITTNKKQMEYYTYAYLREDGTPYYIGKGKGFRLYVKKRIVPLPSRDRIIYLKKNITEHEAIKHEIYMIAVYGRKDNGTGILRNLTDGGEGTSGKIMSEEQKKSHSLRMSGANHPFYGKTASKSHRENISNALFGKKKTKDHIEKLPQNNKGAIRSQEFKNKRKNYMTGRRWWNNGAVEKLFGG
jgi:hypothetical protein